MLNEYTYEQAYAEVLQLIAAPSPQFVRESYKTFYGVYKATKEELKNLTPSVEIFGWDFFNMATGGLRLNEFSILCGPTGAGKTSLLANLAVKLLMGKCGAFVASVEIGSNDFMKKMISIIMERDLESINDASDIDATCKQILSSTNSVFSNYDSRVNHLQLMCDIYHAHKTKGVQVALIDNLNFLMDVAESKNQVIEMDRAIHEFVVFCKKVPIHVIMVMHPKKTENGRVESEFDIKGSSTAVQEASNVFLFNRVKDEASVPMTSMAAWCREIKFAKVRKRGKSVGSRVIFEINNRGEGYREICV